MAILLMFVTANHEIVNTIKKRRDTLIPPDMRRQNFASLGGEAVVISAFRVNLLSNQKQLISHLRSLDLANFSSVILLTDDFLPKMVDVLGDIFSVSRFIPPRPDQKMGNILTSIVTKILRAFGHFRTRFADRKYETSLRVPLRNFVAPEIAELRFTCRNIISRGNFRSELDGLLGKLRGRQFPKKASRGPMTYLVDDVGKHFRLGREIHAQADTASPPHNELCLLSNTFRFGCSFNGREHFNVSLDKNKPLNGCFADCHGLMRSGGDAQHLNMFSNDFF